MTEWEIDRAWHCDSYTTMCLWLKTLLLEALSFTYNYSSRHVSPMYVQIYLVMSPLRRNIFVCFMAKSAFLGGFWALAP